MRQTVACLLSIPIFATFLSLQPARTKMNAAERRKTSVADSSNVVEVARLPIAGAGEFWRISLQKPQKRRLSRRIFG
jgi:hypothetical protein